MDVKKNAWIYARAGGIWSFAIVSTSAGNDYETYFQSLEGEDAELEALRIPVATMRLIRTRFDGGTYDQLADGLIKEYCDEGLFDADKIERLPQRWRSAGTR